MCEPHRTLLAGAYDYVDLHPAEIMCAMPGFGWLTEPSQPSRCVIVTTDLERR
ncbi:hypothetical protein ACIQPQ_34455 [Streptomyces sp. NPDC091281]|uniref:hypothetical protein n=1 Tax=Streptomyces sp. NPDC091281 TaxID=3365985 RepID=UPI003825EA82